MSGTQVEQGLDVIRGAQFPDEHISEAQRLFPIIFGNNDTGTAAGLSLIQNALTLGDTLRFQQAIDARRRGVIQGTGNQGRQVRFSINTQEEAAVVGLRSLAGQQVRAPLTAVEKAKAFAEKIKLKQEVEGDASTSILASLIAGADKNFFTRDVEIPAEIEEDEEETLGSQTILAG